MDRFHELLHTAQGLLTARASGIQEVGPVPAETIVAELFAAGKESGLTEKEIVRVLIKPVVTVLRPGLTR